MGSEGLVKRGGGKGGYERREGGEVREGEGEDKLKVTEGDGGRQDGWKGRRVGG